MAAPRLAEAACQNPISPLCRESVALMFRTRPLGADRCSTVLQEGQLVTSKSDNKSTLTRTLPQSSRPDRTVFGRVGGRAGLKQKSMLLLLLLLQGGVGIRD